MPRLVLAFLFTALLCIGCAQPLAAQSALDDGFDAFQRGNYPEALDILRPVADEGDFEAQFLVGLMFDGALGVARDAAQAARYYRLSAEQGHPGGALYFAVLLQQGDGVKQNLPQAIELYEAVVEMPDVGGTRALAAHSLGELYLDGELVSRDVSEAMEWFTVAAEAGSVDAQFQLGYMYVQGDEVAQNDSLAIVWLRRASQHRHTRSMGLLMAALVDSAKEEALVEAYMWGSLAAELDPLQRATAGRYVLRERLTSEQIERAEVMMEEWRTRWRALEPE